MTNTMTAGGKLKGPNLSRQGDTLRRAVRADLQDLKKAVSKPLPMVVKQVKVTPPKKDSVKR